MPTFYERAGAVADDIVTLLGKKRADYGQNNIKDEAGILVRLDDKVSRLKSLYNNQDGIGAVVTESLDDTWIDVAGYAIIALLFRKNEWRDRPCDEIEIAGDVNFAGPWSNPTETPKRSRVRSVYLSGSIDLATGQHWRNTAQKMLVAEDIAVLRPDLCVSGWKQHPELVVVLNQAAVLTCDVILAYLDKNILSIGTIVEILFALDNNRRVVIIADFESCYLHLLKTRGAEVVTTTNDAIKSISE